SLAVDLGDPATAEHLAKDAATRGRDIDPAAFASAISVLAGLAESKGDFAGAMALLEELKAPPVRETVPHATAVAATARARIALIRSGPEGAAPDIEMAETAAQEVGDERLKASILAMRAGVAFCRGDLSEAESLFAALLHIGDRLGDLRVLAEAEA